MSSVVHIFHIWADDPQDAASEVRNNTEFGCNPGYVIDREGVKTIEDRHVCDGPEDQYSFATINEAVEEYYEFEFYQKFFEEAIAKYNTGKKLTSHDWNNIRYHAQYMADVLQKADFDINKDTDFRANEWDMGRWGVTTMNKAVKNDTNKKEYLVVCSAHY